MSLEEKFQEASRLIEGHYRALDNTVPVDPQAVINNLKQAGGTSEERLKLFSFEDILACFPDVSQPKVLAKEIAAVFRGPTGCASGGPQYVSTARAERMAPMDLVQAFDPEDQDNAVAKRLKEMSKGQPFVVYENGRNVNALYTKRMLDELRFGYPPRDTYGDDRGQVFKLYRIGEVPDALVDENPLYVGRPLRPDGTCDQTGRSWAGVPLEVRQLTRLIRELRASLDIDQANALIDQAVAPDAMKALRRKYQKVSVRFDELQQTGALPTLRVALNQKAEPLQAGKKVAW